MNITIKELQLLHEAGKIETPQFINVKNYQNAKGETCNYLINLGTNFQNAKEADNIFLQFISAEDLDFSEELKPFAKEARSILLQRSTQNLSENIEDRTLASQGQSNAYDKVVPNIRLHKNTEQLHIFGKIVRKSYAENSFIAPKTIRRSGLLVQAQNIFKKHFSTNGYITLKISNTPEVKINGKTIILNLA